MTAPEPTNSSIGDLLAELSFFEGLDPDLVELLAGCGRNTSFSEGEFLLREGEAADTFYVVRRGRVSIEVDRPAQGALTIDTAGPGDIVGVSCVLPPYRNAFDARAVAPTGAIALDAACLRGKCDDDPTVGYAVFQRFAGVIRERLLSSRMRLLDLYGSRG